MSNKIEINISSSALSHGNCMLELYRTIVLGLKEPTVGAALIYGVGVHKYRDVMFKTPGDLYAKIPAARKAAMESFMIPKEDNRKSPHLSDERHMITTAFNYWETYISKDTQFDIIELSSKCIKCQGSGIDPACLIDDNDKTCNGCNGHGTRMQPATELTFSIPYIETDLFRVNLAGTIDGLGKIKGGGYSIQDLKTTSTWDTKSYLKKYELSKQLRFYRLVLKLMSQMYPESALGKIGATKVGAFIDVLFIKPSTIDNEYMRSDVYQFSDDHIVEFEVGLRKYIYRMLDAFAHPETLTRDGIITGACEKGYGKLCTFFNVCAQQDNRVGEVLLKRDFIVKPFDPLHYSD